MGSAGWGNPVNDTGQTGYGIAGAIPVETYDLTFRNPKNYVTIPPMRYLSSNSKLIEIAIGGLEHCKVKADPVSLRRLIAWVDTNCPYRGEQEVRAIPDPEFPGVDLLPIRPRIKTAPVIRRP